MQDIPQHVDTLISWLNLDPVVTRLICCKQCFAMYPISPNSPSRCIHKFLATPDYSLDSPHHRVCSAPLFKTRGMKVPIRTYGFQDLHGWIAKLFSRPGIEDALDQVSIRSQVPFNPQDPVHDIHDSSSWKLFLGPNGQQFTASSNHLAFCLYTDGINAFGNRQAGKHASITFLILVCLTLPVELRFLPENIYIAGIAPGPSEPSLEQTNWILRPVVEQLKLLWNPGLSLSRTHNFPEGRHVHGALFTFLADLPATRRALGFSSTSSAHICSYCLLTQNEITNFDSSSWPRRTVSDHRIRASESHHAESFAEKEEIFDEHGVRYSCLLELEYWDIVNMHTVDSMHNLLLGLVKWHLKRFWAMSDGTDEPEPGGVGAQELVDILADATRFSSPPAPVETHGTDSQLGLVWLFDVEGGDEGYSLDEEGFTPSTGDPLEDAWSGQWVPLSEDQIFIDSQALAFINLRLPRINIPTWIKQALPVLGKASHGRLKADEWRTLFTVQLPLILPLYWKMSDHEHSSLLCNFAHLVSLVNIGLKRTMDFKLIEKYRHHLQTYLQSSLILFEGRTFAPNHHMAIHLAECLERFGPVRSWWTFPLERLMGTILKACHNNRLGELEITFLKAFGRLGNLRVLLASDNLPDKLKPYITQLQAFCEPPKFQSRYFDPSHKNQLLPSGLLDQLIKRINSIFYDEGCTYIHSHKWRRKHRSQKIAPINARIEPLNSFCADAKVTYSTYTTTAKNAIIQYRATLGEVAFGRIEQLFNHSRVTADAQTLQDTWVVVNQFPLIPSDILHPFSSAQEISSTLDQECIVLVSLSR
ncbi:hypothetical protein PSTT_14106 [Puccinia striiformis]|uniref:DUF4218 domain-containing protein n=1 Tax=Puccinia striiformis TaxID=27350 RepID=A0A2S4UNQ6_9BASI|nr:hypothetical protein PSTT_14106 [Puccinia striiformis]